MADRYWIGANTNWDDTANWSTTSGGSGGAAVPTSVDNVYFDSNSFGTTTTVSLAVGSGNASCRDFIWDGFSETPTFSAGFNDTLNVHGTFKLAENMTWSGSSMYLYFKGAGDHEIWTRSKTLWPFYLYMQATGTYTVMDKLAIGSNSPQRDLKFYSGTLDMNGKIMDVRDVLFYGSDEKIFKIEGATISFKGNVCNWDEEGVTNLTIVANELTNIETTYNAATTLNWKGGGFTFGGSINLKNTTNDETLKIYGDNTFHTINIQGDIADPGVTKTLQLEAGKTQNVTSFYAKGTSTDYVNINSLTAGSQGYLRKTFGSSVCDYISIKDCGGRGGAVWWAGANSQDLGNNA